MMSFLKVSLVTVAVIFSSSVHAQETENDDNEVSVETTKIITLPPAYEKQMMRLSEILGALHYIRELCGADEGQKWRNEMQQMVEKEEPSDEQKSKLIASFNSGFRGFQESYRECTPSAIEANNRYITEGTKLSGEIPTRYGR
jgi:uncharacterized protein (TIGR02301 family)